MAISSRTATEFVTDFTEQPNNLYRNLGKDHVPAYGQSTCQYHAMNKSCAMANGISRTATDFCFAAAMSERNKQLGRSLRGLQCQEVRQHKEKTIV